MKIEALNDSIVVKIIEEEKKTASGLIIPQVQQKKHVKCKVIAVGPQVKQTTGARIEEGEIIIFPSRILASIELNGEDFLIGKSVHAIMIIKE